MTSRPWRHWYKTKKWRYLRRACFKRDGFKCQTCGSVTFVTKDRKDPLAATCDHKVAHKGDEGLFFDINNLQTLCKSCHDGAKQYQEHHGYSKEHGTDGWPVDPKHPFNSPKNH